MQSPPSLSHYKSMAQNIDWYIDDEAFFATRSTEEISRILENVTLNPTQFIKLFSKIYYMNESASIYNILQSVKLKLECDKTTVCNVLKTVAVITNIEFFNTIAYFIKHPHSRSSIKSKTEILLPKIVGNIEESSTPKESVSYTARNDDNAENCLRPTESVDQPDSNTKSKNQTNSSNEIDSALELTSISNQHGISKSTSSVTYISPPILENIPAAPENLRKLRTIEKSSDNFYIIYGILSKSMKENDVTTIKGAVDEGYDKVRLINRNNMILWAARNGDLNLVKTLHEFGSDVNSVDDSRRNILHNFCMRGNLEGVKYATEFFDINEVNNDNSSALHFAAYNDRADVCEFLCKLPNIQKNIQDSSGKTPLMIAKENKNQKCIDVLTKFGCL